MFVLGATGLDTVYLATVPNLCCRRHSHVGARCRALSWARGVVRGM